MAESSVQGEYKAMLALKPVTNLIAPQIQLGSGTGSPLRASFGSNPRSNSGFYLNLSGCKAKGSEASADLFGGGGVGGGSNRPDPLLDLDRVPLPLPPISFEGRPIVRVERNRHYSPLARAFLPFYLFDDAGRQYLVITGNRQLVEAAQSQLQLPIISPSSSSRALPPNIFSVATTDGLPAGRLYLFGNKLTLLATQDDQDQDQAVESSGGSREKAKAKAKAQASKGSGRVGWFGLKRVPVPIVLRFVEIRGIAQPQPQSNP